MHAWQSQYEQPTIEQLLGDFDGSDLQLVERMRGSIAKTLGKKPRLEWTGLSWNWCETSRPEGSDTLRVVYLVLDPQSPRVVLHLSIAFFERHPPSSLPKSLHPGLSRATNIGQQTWCQWPISSGELVDAVTQLMTLACA